MTFKFKYLKDKVAYATSILNDIPLPAVLQHSVNPLLVEAQERIIEISIVLSKIDLTKDYIKQLKLLQVHILKKDILCSKIVGT